MLSKQCKICGAEFTPRLKTQKCCCKECSKENARQMTKKNYNKNYHRKWKQAKSKCLCRICGKPIKRLIINGFVQERTTMHEECILKDCYNTLHSGKELSNRQYMRIRSRGITMEDVYDYGNQALHNLR